MASFAQSYCGFDIKSFAFLTSPYSLLAQPDCERGLHPRTVEPNLSCADFLWIPYSKFSFPGALTRKSHAMPSTMGRYVVGEQDVALVAVRRSFLSRALSCKYSCETPYIFGL